MFCLAVTCNVSAQTTPQEMLNKAIYEEEVNGNLEEAIKLFLEIVEKNSTNRTVTAEAFYHLGLSNEKLGNKKAKEYYEKVVNNFADQPEFVRIAKERLSKLLVVEKVSKTPLVPKFTKINIPTEFSSSIKLSPNGKDLVLVSDEKLWKMPVSGNLGPEFSGIPVQINTEGIEVFYTGLSWSGDGKWIAFNENIKGDLKDKGIYIVSSAGGKPNKIVETNRGIRIINYGISLSPNGEKLAFSSIVDKKQYVHSISVDGSNHRQLTDMEAREPVYSPNGKMIAYVEDKSRGKGSGDLGLWVVSTHNGTPHLVANAEKAYSPVWSPDSKKIAFLEYNNGKQIKIVHDFSDSASPGKVTSIDLPEGMVEVLHFAGWTPDNKIGALLRTKVEFGLYTLPAKGGQPAIVLSEGNTVQPRWSPDSKKIYYINDNDVLSYTSKTLGVVSAAGGKGKLLSVRKDVLLNFPYQYQAGNRISPDGKLIISAASASKELGYNKPPSTQIWKIPIDGGTPTQITNPNPSYGDFAPSWSPDGKQVAFLRLPLKIFSGKEEVSCAIYMLNIDDRIPKLLLEEKYILSPVWSPDGKMIAYLSLQDDDVSSINVVNVINGESEMIMEIPKNSDVHTDLAWSPDSKSIAFLDNKSKVVKVVSLSEGSIEDVETNLEDVRIYHLDWSPDGKRFVFGGVKDGNKEFWFMEDFLPLEKLAQKKTLAVETPKVMTSKKIWEEDEIDNLGEISPDGKYISYTDWPAGDLAIYEIATGKKRRLTNYNFGETWGTGAKTTYVLSSIWSADSRQIIYSTGRKEIRTIGLENSTPRTIRKKETKNEWVVQVSDISGDGETILGTIETMDTTTQIILFSVRDGEKQIIKELSGIRIVGKLKFTSDGAGVVYDYPPDLDSPVHDIYCLSLDGKTETPIIKHPAHDFVLDLSPDGNQLLFASSRSGKMGFYYVGLKNGKTQGNPKFIKTSEYPNLTGLGFSDNGVFYSFYQPFVTDVYETEINSETGAIISHPNEIIGSFMGENSAPDYSSDGKYLAFISRRSPFFTRENGIPTGNVLCIKSLKNGNIREIRPNIENFGIPKWSPDNRSILMMKRNTERTTEIYKIDLQSDKLSLIFSDKNKKIFDFEWCADGMSIFMVLQYQENDTTKHKLVRYNLETKEEKILFVNHGRKGYFPDLATISCSPDGNWIAFLGLDQKKTIKIIPTSGGEVREIYSLDKKKTIEGKIWSSKSYANEFIHHCWSADGKYIYLQKFREPRGDGIWNLWQIPVNGGNPVNLGLEITYIWQISAHPDGRKLVYSNKGSSYKLPQIWMMENFLPKEETENKLKQSE